MCYAGFNDELSTQFLTNMYYRIIHGKNHSMISKWCSTVHIYLQLTLISIYCTCQRSASLIWFAVHARVTAHAGLLHICLCPSHTKYELFKSLVMIPQKHASAWQRTACRVWLDASCVRTMGQHSHPALFITKLAHATHSHENMHRILLNLIRHSSHPYHFTLSTCQSR